MKFPVTITYTDQKFGDLRKPKTMRAELDANRYADDVDAAIEMLEFTQAHNKLDYEWDEDSFESTIRNYHA